MESSISKKNISKKEAWVLVIAAMAAIIFGFLDAWLPWFIVLAGLAAGVIALLALKNPFWGLLLLIFFLPFERLGAYEISGLTVRISQLMLIITITAWFLNLVWRQHYPSIRNPLLIPLVVFLLINIFSLPNSLNLNRSLAVLVFTIFTSLLALIVPMLVTDKEKVNKVVIFLLISFVVVSVFGLFQFVGDMSGLATSLTGLRELYTKNVLGFTRIQSTAYEPLYFANYLLIPIAIVFALFLAGHRGIIKIGWLIMLFGLGVINLILTVSRGGYLALAAVLMIVAFFYMRKVFTWRNIIIFIIAGLAIGWIVTKTLGVGGGFFTMEKFQEHVSNAFYGASYDERIETFDQAITAWREHPALGVGVGGFGPYVSPHPSYMPKDGWRIVNNEFLEILAETGALGLFFFVLLILMLIVRSLKAISVTHDSYLRAILVGSLGAFVGVLVQYQTFSTLYIMHIWFLIGLMIAVQNIILISVSKTKI